MYESYQNKRKIYGNKKHFLSFEKKILWYVTFWNKDKAQIKGDNVIDNTAKIKD